MGVHRMNNRLRRIVMTLVTGLPLIAASTPLAAQRGVEPGGAVKQDPATEVAVFAGGCFWGVEAVFEHVRGVTSAVSGYAGGSAATADYEKVSSGSTDHAEVVQVTFDPSKVTYADLLRVFFSVAHDPTQLNRQGPDHGTQYRSAIFYTSEDQKATVKAYI